MEIVIISLDQVTEGQACTCEIGLKSVNDLDRPLTIGACDNGMLWNKISTYIVVPIFWTYLTLNFCNIISMKTIAR